MSRKLIVGAGTCIIEAVILGLRAIPGLDEHVELHLSQIRTGGRPVLPEEVLRRCAVLIEEAAPWQGGGTLSATEREMLPADCVTVKVPTLHFNALWPLMVEDPRNRPEPDAPYGRLTFGMADRLALRLHQTLPDLASRRAAYRATELASVVNLARAQELETRNFFAREQGCDVRVAAFVNAYFREKRLFYTHSHPTGELVSFMLCQILALPAMRDVVKQPYDRTVTAVRRWGETSNVFAGEEAPIHPAVAAHYDLKWWHPDLRYRWLGQSRSFDEWVDFCLSYDPDAPVEVAAQETEFVGVQLPDGAPAAVVELRPDLPETLPVGPFLTALRDRGVAGVADRLMPAGRVTRVPLLTMSGIDETRAPFGRMFREPQYRHYDLAEAIVAGLGEAMLFGDTGLVAHQGEILADTFRGLFPGALIAAVEANRVSLTPAGQSVARILGDAHFQGFGPLWWDYGHWLFTSLPRLAAFVRLRARLPGLRVILPRFDPTSFQAETLTMLGIRTEDITEIGPGEVVACEALFVTGVFDLWQVSPFCRDAALRLVESAGMPRGPASRIYVRSARAAMPLADADLLHAALAVRGFEIVSIDDMSLREQMAVFRGADVVVAEHGPALANLFFARIGTKVLELFGPDSAQPLYWSLATVCGLGYGLCAARLNGAGAFDFQAALYPWMLDTVLEGISDALAPTRD